MQNIKLVELKNISKLKYLIIVNLPSNGQGQTESEYNLVTDEESTYDLIK